MFYFDTIGGKKILRSDLIRADHFFTTRESFITTKEADLANITSENKDLICKYLKIREMDLISPCQTHTDNIEHAVSGKNIYPDTDGLIVSDKDIAVFLNFADCTPVILYDEVRNIGAISHAGWRGTAANIASKTVKKMVEEFGCKSKNISAVIGPAISMCCYNVGEDVFRQLHSLVDNFDGLYEIRGGNIYVNLKGINRRQLQECGVEKIDVCPYCTCCNNDLFFSYRKENATTNRHSAVLKIK